MPLIRVVSRSGVDDRGRLGETHTAESAGEAHRSARGDHRLRRYAVPQVRGTSEDVAFDHGDLRTEPRGVGRSLVAGRATTDDDESHRARLERRSRAGVHDARPPSAGEGCRRSAVAVVVGFVVGQLDLTGEQYTDSERRRVRERRTIRDRPTMRPTRCWGSRSTDSRSGPALADPFEVHAVGSPEVAAPREAVLAEDAHDVAVHTRSAPGAVRSWCSCRTPCRTCDGRETRSAR